jgi:hypothetical protein
MYKLEMSHRPIATFLPQRVPILDVPGYDGFRVFWPRMRPKSRKPADTDNADVEIDELDGAEHVDHLGGDEGDDDGSHELGEPPLEHPAILDDFVASLDAPLDVDTLMEPDEIDSPPGPPGVPDDPPPLPPPADDPAPARTRKKAQENSDFVVAFSGGKITYYKSNGNFEAVCGVEWHGSRCTLTRKGTGAAASSAALGGRCLGLLALWVGVGALCEDKAAHTDKDFIQELSDLACRGQRLDYRRDLQAAPLSAPLFTKEREKLDGEDSEPDTCT